MNKSTTSPVSSGKTPLKWGTKEYWLDWYWNKGGREKVQARRKLADYNRYKKKRQKPEGDQG